MISLVTHTRAVVDAVNFTDDDEFGQAIQSKVTVSRVGVSEGKRAVDTEQLV